MIRRPPRSTLSSSSAASDVYKRQVSPQSAGTVFIAAMSSAAWMNERIVKENTLFPPKQQDPNRKPGKTQRDCFKVNVAEADWIQQRRKNIWSNGSFSKRSASNKLTTIHNAEIKTNPLLADPVEAFSQEERDQAAKNFDDSHELRNKTFGRPKCEEVAFCERMQTFSSLTRD
eukprot:TRINITY_DN32612_c0_g1_i1.p1 TRINITY_DN32612_c0_g1~~TRINITY_DN32612_c0_g1_i1.p1  ORF type:complete len:173 (-),score=41.42 TRINITY_DN32612_c0_g1_i1:333-851(-)